MNKIRLTVTPGVFNYSNKFPNPNNLWINAEKKTPTVAKDIKIVCCL